MAIISQSHQFIFVHIPFCGGSLIKAALDPLLHWNDVIIGTTLFGKKLETAYRQRYRVHEFSTISDVARMMGSDISSYNTMALICDPDHRIREIYKTAWSDLRFLALNSAVPLNQYLAELRKGRGPQSLLNRTPIRAAIWAESDEDFVKRLLALSSQTSGISLLSFEHWLKGGCGEVVNNLFTAEAIEVFRLYLEKVIEQPIKLPYPVTPLNRASSTAQEMLPALLISEASRKLLRMELKYDYELYESVASRTKSSADHINYQL